MSIPNEYNPSIDGPLRTTYDGPHKRAIPYDDGVWHRKYQVWIDRNGQKVGAWKWVRNRAER